MMSSVALLYLRNHVIVYPFNKTLEVFQRVQTGYLSDSHLREPNVIPVLHFLIFPEVFAIKYKAAYFLLHVTTQFCFEALQ